MTKPSGGGEGHGEAELPIAVGDTLPAAATEEGIVQELFGIVAGDTWCIVNKDARESKVTEKGGTHLVVATDAADTLQEGGLTVAEDIHQGEEHTDVADILHAAATEEEGILQEEGLTVVGDIAPGEGHTDAVDTHLAGDMSVGIEDLHILTIVTALCSKIVSRLNVQLN